MPRNRDFKDDMGNIRGAIPGKAPGTVVGVTANQGSNRPTRSTTNSERPFNNSAIPHPEARPAANGARPAALQVPTRGQAHPDRQVVAPVAQGEERTPAAASSFAARFGRAIVQHGIAAIPSALFHYQGSLDLSAQEVWFTSYVMCFKWDENLPRVNLSQMEKRVGMGKRSLYRLKEQLCEAGYLKVFPVFADNGRQDSSAYDFSGLFEQIERLILADPPKSNPIHTDEPDETESDGADDELAERDMSFMARFGRVIARYGVAAIPQAIFTYQAALGLRPQQVWFIAYIFSYQWKKALPYPSIVKMSARTGYSTVQLHDIKASLVQLGYLRLVPRSTKSGGRDSNAYDFSGLFDAIRAHLQRDHAQSKSSAARNENQTPAPAGRARPSRRRGRAAAQCSTRTPNRDEGDAELPYQGDSEFPPQGDAKLTEEGGSELLWQGDSRFAYQNGSGLIEDGDSQFSWEGDAQFAEESDRSLSPHASQKPPTKVTRSLQKRVSRDAQDVEHIQEEQIKRDDSNHISRNKNVTQRTSPPATASVPSSPYIVAVMDDFSNELNDPDHKTSNATQALRIWQATDKSDQEFIQLVYEAKQLTRQYQGKNGSRGIENKMAYFFKVLRDLCGLRDVQATSAPQRSMPDSTAREPGNSSRNRHGTSRPDQETVSAISARQLWQAALAELQTTIPAQSFQTWLRSTSIAGFAEDTVVVAVPSNFAKEWLEKRFSRQIAETLYNVLGYAVDVRFEVKASGPMR